MNRSSDLKIFMQALEAVQKVLDMTKKKRIDNDLLDKVMQDLEMRVSATHSVSLASINITDSADAISDVNHADKVVGSEADLACGRETEHLIQLLGKILRQVN